MDEIINRAGYAQLPEDTKKLAVYWLSLVMIL